MKVLLTALHEVYGLFVEDGSYALVILLWLGAAAFVFPHLPGGSGWRAPVLFVGLIVLLVENVRRSARK
jgi:membrane protein implicated in regulation of membrane protease activity